MVPIIAGPTASGKSSAALALAEKFGLEIVSADSMQVYRGMDIGTAKPSLEEQRRVPHHLIDVVTPAQRFSVADYVRLAEASIGSVLAAGRLPLLVGGTGFYVRALMRGLPSVPPADPAVQAPLWREVEAGRFEALLAELAAAAPSDARRAGRNPRRVVRSLEVVRRTGRPPSDFPREPPRFAYSLRVLAPDTPLLNERIDRRAEAMFAAGLVEETRELLELYPEQPTALQAIGYKEVLAHLRGEASVGEALAAVALATRQYAKRQRTWFRAERGAIFLPVTGEEALSELGGWLEALLGGRGVA